MPSGNPGRVRCVPIGGCGNEDFAKGCHLQEQVRILPRQKRDRHWPPDTFSVRRP
jgi:hypothetical protein